MESKEVKNLRGKLLGMEMELQLLSKDLDRFETELAYNKKVLGILNENLLYLKNNAVSISIQEFKKTIKQKDFIEMKIKYYIQKIQPLQQTIEKRQKSFEKEYEKFKYEYRMQFKNNILEFPGDRRRKKQNKKQ
jgi:hypothetical protein